MCREPHFPVALYVSLCLPVPGKQASMGDDVVLGPPTTLQNYLSLHEKAPRLHRRILKCLACQCILANRLCYTSAGDCSKKKQSVLGGG